jgi:hypothetical protein
VTPLLSVPLALALTALLGLALLAAAIGTVLLLLLALLALDVLLERNGVDRRSGVLSIWRRLRRPARAAGEPEAPAEQPAAKQAARIPFSSRRPGRPLRPEPVAEPVPEPTAEQVEPERPAAEPPVAAEQSAPEPPHPAAVAAEEPPTPEADAVTEVLVVEPTPEPRARAPRAPRAPRVTPRRTPTPEPGPAPESAPADRDSALDRLFAPLLESDRTEPLPRATRPAKRPRDDV